MNSENTAISNIIEPILIDSQTPSVEIHNNRREVAPEKNPIQSYFEKLGNIYNSYKLYFEGYFSSKEVPVLSNPRFYKATAGILAASALLLPQAAMAQEGNIDGTVNPVRRDESQGPMFTTNAIPVGIGVLVAGAILYNIFASSKKAQRAKNRAEKNKASTEEALAQQQNKIITAMSELQEEQMNRITGGKTDKKYQGLSDDELQKKLSQLQQIVNPQNPQTTPTQVAAQPQIPSTPTAPTAVPTVPNTPPTPQPVTNPTTVPAPVIPQPNVAPVPQQAPAIQQPPTQLQGTLVNQVPTSPVVAQPTNQQTAPTQPPGNFPQAAQLPPQAQYPAPAQINQLPTVADFQVEAALIVTALKDPSIPAEAKKPLADRLAYINSLLTNNQPVNPTINLQGQPQNPTTNPYQQIIANPIRFEDIIPLPDPQNPDSDAYLDNWTPDPNQWREFFGITIPELNAVRTTPRPGITPDGSLRAYIEERVLTKPEFSKLPEGYMIHLLNPPYSSPTITKDEILLHPGDLSIGSLATEQTIKTNTNLTDEQKQKALQRIKLAHKIYHAILDKWPV